MSGLLPSLGNSLLRLKTQIWDDDGNEIWYKDGEAHSFNRNIHNIAATQILDLGSTDSSGGSDSTAGASSLRLIDVTGTTLADQDNPYNIGSGNLVGQGYNGPVGDSTHGIVVGTGTSGFTFEDFQLGTAIISGSAAGELGYSSAEPTVVTFASSRFSADYARFFNNNTTATITVGEIGMVSQMITPSQAEVMVCRDALSTTLPIPSGGQLKVTYTFTSPAFTT